MAGVQFIGVNSIMDAFSERAYDHFALFEGKTLLVTGCGSGELHKWLTMIGQSGTYQQYLLKIFKDDPGNDACAADHDACFKVQINDRVGGYMGGVSPEYTKRLEALEKKNEGPDEDPLTEAFMGWIEEPSKLVQVIGAIKDLLGMGAPQAAVGTILPKTGEKGTIIVTPDKEAEVNRLAKSLDELEKVDPDIVSAIEKLAAIAKSKPDTYRSLRSMLNAY